jgi:transcriptional regulator with XRE-family HTH domain
MEFKISLAAARVNAGMTQKDTAERLSVNKSSVVAWETGKTVPNQATVMALAQIYKIPAEFLDVPEK